jgi:hypothetical protein
VNIADALKDFFLNNMEKILIFNYLKKNLVSLATVGTLSMSSFGYAESSVHADKRVEIVLPTIITESNPSTICFEWGLDGSVF